MAIEKGKPILASDVLTTLAGYRGGDTIAIGDSITAGGQGAFSLSGGTSFFTYASLLSGGRMRIQRNAGIAGNTTAQMLARLETDVLAYRPDRCIVTGGTNDIDMPGYSFIQTITNLTAIWDTLLSLNIQPIVCSIPPRGITNWMAETIKLNTAIRLAAEKRNIPFIDLWSVWVDPETGMYKAGYNTDSLHPTANAGKIAGEYLWNSVESLYANAPLPYMIMNPNDGLNLVTNGLFKDTDGNGVADNWTAFIADANVTHSIEDDANIPGNWQIHTRVASGSNTPMSQLINRTWQDGDTLEIAGQIETTDLTTTASVQLLIPSSGGITVEPVSSIGANVKGVFRMRIIPPDGAANINLRIRLGTVGTGTVKVAQLSMINLTALER